MRNTWVVVAFKLNLNATKGIALQFNYCMGFKLIHAYAYAFFMMIGTAWRVQPAGQWPYR